MNLRLKTIVAAALASFALAPAFAGNTTFLTDRNGQQVFPISPPNRANSTPGAIDNMTIGATTPAPGNFTTFTFSSQACTATPCVNQGLNSTQGGSIAVKGGTSSTSGNAGGAAQLTGGVPGATGVGGAAQVTGGIGGSTSGSGGAATVTGGAGTAGNANGGDVTIAGGAANGSGVNGVVRENGVRLVQQGAPAAATTSATLTAANVLAGIITVNQGGAGASAQQLPLATAMDTALPTSVAGDSFDFSVVNISTVAAESASLTTNTGWTLVGDMDVSANSAATTKSAGRFRARKTATGAWTIYRLS